MKRVIRTTLSETETKVVRLHTSYGEGQIHSAVWTSTIEGGMETTNLCGGIVRKAAARVKRATLKLAQEQHENVLRTIRAAELKEDEPS